MSDLTTPRSWEGTILKATELPDGGAKLEAWDRLSKTWLPSTRWDKLMESGVASPEEMREAGIPLTRR
jgi:hypothetical protein